MCSTATVHFRCGMKRFLGLFTAAAISRRTSASASILAPTDEARCSAARTLPQRSRAICWRSDTASRCGSAPISRTLFTNALSELRSEEDGLPVPSHDALPSLDFVVEEWPRLQAKWEAWADASADADIARQVPFKSRFVGNAGLPAWQIVMHGLLAAGEIRCVTASCWIRPA